MIKCEFCGSFVNPESSSKRSCVYCIAHSQIGKLSIAQTILLNGVIEELLYGESKIQEEELNMYSDPGVCFMARDSTQGSEERVCE